MDSSHVVEGFLKSWGMILASEIGDKTFFIAAIMAMKHSRSVVTSPWQLCMSCTSLLSVFRCSGTGSTHSG